MDAGRRANEAGWCTPNGERSADHSKWQEEQKSDINLIGHTNQVPAGSHGSLAINDLRRKAHLMAEQTHGHTNGGSQYGQRGGARPA